MKDAHSLLPSRRGWLKTAGGVTAACGSWQFGSVITGSPRVLIAEQALAAAEPISARWQQVRVISRCRQSARQPTDAARA
jgi:hypothetical protein